MWSASQWRLQFGPGVNLPLSPGYGLFDLLTFENYRWAYATIRSRAAYLDEETQGARQAIVPVGDLFNHSTTAPNVAAAYDAAARGYVYTATQPIAAGDELLVSYGAHDNATLLKHYGFVPRGPNPHDRVAVTLARRERPQLSQKALKVGEVDSLPTPLLLPLSLLLS